MENSATALYNGDRALKQVDANQGFAHADATTDFQRLRKPSEELQELRQITNPNAKYATSETAQLRKQVRGLTGFLIAAVIALGGAIAGATLFLWNEQASLRNQYHQLAEQVRTLENRGMSAEEFEQIEAQLTALNQRIQELSKQAQTLIQQVPEVTSAQFETIQRQLQALEGSIRENLSRENTLSQFYTLNETLQQILDNQRNRVSPSETLDSSQPSQSTEN